ncbi:hypothetical protein E3G68_005155 [Mycobacteroides abscessus]|nr:hypothetical protein [Mycobacteroides abscessus]
MSQRPYTSVWSDLTGTEFSQGFIDAGGYRTRYLHAGDATQPTLILLHGITGHAEAYVRNLRSHAEHFSVWAIDLIGHGYSAKPDHPLEIAHYVDHVLKFTDAIGAQSAHFSGESVGGWTAARLAIDHPEKVDRVALNTMGGTMANPQVMERIFALRPCRWPTPLGLAGTSSQERTSIQRRPCRLTAMVFTRPCTWRCTVTFTWPMPCRYTRSCSGRQRAPSPSLGHSTESKRALPLNRGYPGVWPAFTRRKNPSNALFSRRNVACWLENDHTA